MKTTAATLVLATFSLTACLSHRGYILPEPIARTELQCFTGPVRIVDIDHRTRGAMGCGRRAAFIVTCDHTVRAASPVVQWPIYESECRWERDTPPPNAGGEAVGPMTGGAQ